MYYQVLSVRSTVPGTATEQCAAGGFCVEAGTNMGIMRQAMFAQQMSARRRAWKMRAALFGAYSDIISYSSCERRVIILVGAAVFVFIGKRRNSRGRPPPHPSALDGVQLSHIPLDMTMNSTIVIDDSNTSVIF